MDLEYVILSTKTNTWNINTPTVISMFTGLDMRSPQ